MAAFCSRSRFQEYNQDALVIEEGGPNTWFYIVHRGELAVLVRGKEIHRLSMGEPFGELSLLTGDYATASVVVRSKLASVLMMSRGDFLQFITHDFAVGLRFEELHLRHGRPAFAGE